MGKTDYSTTVKTCGAKLSNPDWSEQILDCKDGKTSPTANSLEHQMGLATDRLSPRLTQAPVITTVNGQSDQTEISGSLLDYVCRNYSGSNKSSACGSSTPLQ